MNNFQERIAKTSRQKGKLVLANDYDDQKNLESRTINNIKTLSGSLCAIKFNFHILLPLGEKQIKKITKLAHEHDLQIIADIKLNDIGNTNFVAAQTLWDLGFDCLIVNPMMGPGNMQKLLDLSHKNKKGLISLCHMSSPEAKVTYELGVNLGSKRTQLYKLFLNWATKMSTDGIIVGATFPEIIQYCKKQSKGKLNIFSPGIGTQGGDISSTLAAGSDYLIVGRTILNSKNPKKIAQEMAELSKN
ncbi:MAG TPA: orotidine 5'-phosphate decarboxylase [Candidatus Nitrosotenuis sp.]|mgnify:FL=1|nr:orotidine 5'-phosphate decarboxylase [Candidatus Nitrosotenuis sp.]HIH68849.1 orotidine 5'-phosphate decarboxylase [Candidatus Nitrosotenuis sp.]